MVRNPNWRGPESSRESLQEGAINLVGEVATKRRETTLVKNVSTSRWAEECNKFS